MYANVNRSNTLLALGLYISIAPCHTVSVDYEEINAKSCQNYIQIILGKTVWL